MPETNPAKTRNSVLHSDTLSRVLGADAMQILRCGICMDFFEVPIVLPCGHTFCLQCLTQMCTHASLNHAPGASQDVRIGCPNCRVLIYATPILRRNVTCNFIIQSLIECLRVREDRGPSMNAQVVNTDGAGDSKNTSLLSSSSSSSSWASPSSSLSSPSPPVIDDNNHADVMRMLNDLDRVTLTLARSNVVDRAFLEIEDIRKEHLARERQRQAERDAKTRDQVRAVQNIMKQSREEEQQQQQQRKHQHQHHHFQQQQQQQQRQNQQQQRQILPRPQLLQDTTKQQQPLNQMQQNVCVNNNQSQPMNLFLGKYPLLATLNNSDSTCFLQHKPHPHLQPQINIPPTKQYQTQPFQQLQQQRFSQQIISHCREGHFIAQSQTQKELQQQPPPPPPQLPPQAIPQHQQLPHQQYSHHQQKQQQLQKQQQQRKSTNTTPIVAKQPIAATCVPTDTHKPGTPPTRLHHEGTQKSNQPPPPHKPSPPSANMATPTPLPSENDPMTKTSSSTSPIDDLQSVTVARRHDVSANVKPPTSGNPCVQLNNDPAVMSFSLVTRMASANKTHPGKSL